MLHEPHDWEDEDILEEVEGEYYEIMITKFTPDGEEHVDVIFFDDKEDDIGFETSYDMDNGKALRLRLEII